MHRSILLSALGLPLALCSALSKRDCNAIALGGKYGADGYTTTYPSTFMVSQPLNCTAELARSDDDNNPRSCSFERYAMGLEVHSSLNITVSDPQQVFDAVKQASGMYHIDFNETIVMNFTNPVSSGYAVNFTGYWGFTPFLRCFEGILTDCDGDDAAANDTAVTACALSILSPSDDPGRVQYDGQIAGVQWVGDYSKYANRTEPQPRYDDVKGNASYLENGGGAAAAGLAGAWGGALAAAMWLTWWSVL